MSLEQIADRVIETDVLVVGGGIAGCPVAVKAAEHGLNVTIVEKANSERSGSAGSGLQRFGGEAPPDSRAAQSVKGDAAMLARFGALLPDLNVRYKIFANTSWWFDEMERYGIPMRLNYAEPNQTGSAGNEVVSAVQWLNIKPLLSQAARKNGVNILQWTMAIDLLTNNGTVVGTTAVNVRTGEFIVIKAKATVIATGQLARNYEQEAPMPWKYKFLYHLCPASLSGDGYALAYRAGAELINMDIVLGGPMFRIRDDLTEGFGHFPDADGGPMKVFTWKEDEILIPNAARYYELEQKGLTPLYYSLEHLPERFQKRLDVSSAHERPISLKIAEDRGFNRRAHRYEVMSLKPAGHNRISGVRVDEDFKASLKGLYAVGDSMPGGGGGRAASAMGLLLGDSLPSFVKEAMEPVVDEGQVESQKQVALAPVAVKDGTEPMELECAVRYACERYAGILKSEGKLREGQRRLGSLKRMFLPQLMAKNPHYLMRCLEARNILDMSEVTLRGMLERKETRGNFIRLDYPETNPAMDGKLICQRLESGKAIIELVEQIGLKPEYTQEEK